ncbi:MAG: phosphate ABC transporter ATP-binding protein [Methyloligella sp. ZOD6]
MIPIQLPIKEMESATRAKVEPVTFPDAFEVNGLTAAYGATPVLHDITCRIPERQVTAIMGPSGCGKSTLIRALNRTLELIPDAVATSGTIRFRGADLYAPGVQAEAVRRGLGIIHQRPVTFPMSILENVLFGASFHGVCTRADGADHARFYLEKVGLWGEVKDRLHDSASSLSGGQQQRLCLARTLANEPQAILMDEPCSALDPSATRRIEEHITELRDEYPIVVVTHNVGQAYRISDQALFLLDGRLIEAGASQTVFETPENPLTLDFISGRLG